MSDRDRARPPPSDRSRQRSRSRSGDRSDRRSDHSRSYHNEPGDQRDPRLRGDHEEGRGYSGGGGGYDRGYQGSGGGGSGGYQDRGRGGYQRGGYQGGDRGSYQGGGGGEGRGGYDRGGSGGGYQGRDQSRGGYDRGGSGGGGYGGGGRGGYQGGGGGGYQGRGGYDNRGGGRGGGPGGGARGPEPPARTEPEAIELYSNFFEVVTNPNWALYQYHVDFDPPQDSKRLKIGLFKPHEHLFGNNKAFDGMTLYSITKLDQQVTVVTSERKTDQLQVKLTIKLVNTIDSCSTETIRMFNIIFKRCLKRANFKEFGRDRAYYDFEHTHNLNKYHLRVAAGYKASMDIYNGKLFLCTELAHKLINDMTVWNVIEDLFQKNGNEAGKAACIDYLVGQTVMTNYNKRSYRIDDIDWNLKPTDRFKTKNGDITYIDYYKNHYQLRIRNESQPLLVSLPKQKDQRAGQTGPILLVPEFCSLTGNILLKEFTRDFTMKKDLDAITKLNPDVRYNRLNQFLNSIKNNPDARTDFDNWQMKLSDDVSKVNATILPNITVVFQGNSLSNTERGWDKAIRNSTHLSSIPLTNWIIMFMPRDQNKAEALNDEICDIARAMNFRVERANLCRLADSRGSNALVFLNGIKEKVRQFNPQIVVCIVPSTNKDIYDSIKQVCCIDFGLPSQVVTSNIINTQNMNKTKSVITKVAVQINCKLGGEIWGVTIPMKNIMIVGMDIYKDSSKKNMSVAAFVATTNGVQDNKLNCTRYFSRCALQQKGQEFSDNLEVFMKDALIKYNEKNGQLPDRIFIYRDGVSDGQFTGVAEYEVPQLKRAFASINQNYNPKLTVLIVKKRGNTRFFFKGGRNEFTNAPMGTVIDNTIVKNPGAEFYLVSQSTNQGTVSPTHFHIVAGEKELQPDRMQNLTFRLTHMYYNWPGQIRVPAPCHYAQKLAHLVGESLHQPQHPSLDELLFYL